MESRNQSLASSGKAIPFIQIEEDDTRKFVVSTEAMALLESGSSRKKVAVVAIAGPYRSGKSFLANRFVGQMGEAFKIGATV